MRAVIILGAGASAPFGVPTLRQLFKEFHARRYLRSNQALADSLQEVFWGPRGKDLESSHETITVEEILTILRDYERCGFASEIPPLVPNLADFKRNLYVLIKKAVYDDKSSDNGRHLNPLINFARTNFTRTTWASFNWDCLFESSFYYSSGDPSAPFSRHNPQVVINLRNWRNTYSSRPQIFLKLHGGVNWWFDNDEIQYLQFGYQPELNNRWRQYEQGTAPGHPVLLEPSYYKYEDPVYELLKEQWGVLIKDLIEAERVVIIGYSLPEADSMARTALTIGFQSGRPDCKWILVNSNESIGLRYLRFFGTRRLITTNMNLEDFSRDIASIVDIT